MKRNQKFFVAAAILLMAILAYNLNTQRCAFLDKCNNEFAIDLYKQIRTDNNDNIAISPFSLTNAMVLPYVGSQNSTAKEIKEIMHFDTNKNSFSKMFSEIKKETVTGNNFTTPEDKNGKTEQVTSLKVAGSMWIDKDYPLFLSYKNTIDKKFGSKVDAADLSKKQPSAKKINNWIAELTNNKIKNIITPEDISDGAPMVLVNTLYFKGRWAEEFEIDCNKHENFSITYGVKAPKKVPVNMMKLKKSLPYTQTKDLEVLRIPHDKSSIEMAIFLPKKPDGLKDLEEKITPDMVDNLINKTQPYAVNVSMPAFRIDNSYQLTKILSDMGLKSPFNKEADFSGISSKKGLYIGNIIQKIILDIDEKGAKKVEPAEEQSKTKIASKTTKTDGIAGSAEKKITETKKPKIEKKYLIKFNANHPYMYVLFDKETQQILFIGRVTNPAFYI
ncbi:MAG: serpin family protein [Alphaproteobacteria bacterium]|nr:serpin family protein [Alphaproteobacteria bacterium]